MSEDIKKTKGVLRMRDVFEKIIVAVEADEIDVSLYAPTTCDTCVHKNKSLEDPPCNKCTTAAEHHGRDYRPSDAYHWRPNMEASPNSIRRYYAEYGTPDLKDLLTHPPIRCINPKCQHDFPEVHDRGLCKHCHSTLEKYVEMDKEVAEEWALMYWLCDSEEERGLIQHYYLQLYTWDRFEVECRCLPKETVGYPDRELILYYRQVRDNDSKRKIDNPTPTLKQLTKTMTEEQLKNTKKYLVIKPKKKKSK